MAKFSDSSFHPSEGGQPPSGPPKTYAWIKPTVPNWRSTPAYHAAINTAFEGFINPENENYVKCAFCDAYYPYKEIAPAHILGAGAHFLLRMEALNILPSCFKCHGRYDGKTDAEQRAAIDKKFPGRISALAALEWELMKVEYEL